MLRLFIFDYVGVTELRTTYSRSSSTFASNVYSENWFQKVC